MATPANDSYSVASGGTIYGGRWGESGVVWRWQQLTVASYSYIPPRDTANNPTYYASTVHRGNTDTSTAVSLTTIPFREYSKPSPTDDGFIYYHGGLHSGYPGNDILKISLATTLPTVQLDRPRVLAQGDLGYSTSGTEKLWKDYSPALAVGDRDQWQPYTYHNYCKNTWHPRLGYLLTNYYPVSWDGTGYPVSSLTTYGDYDGRAYGTMRYDEATNKYVLLSASPQAWILQDLSDYGVIFDGILGLSQHNGNFNFLELSARTSDQWTFSRTVTANAATGTGNQGNSGNGTVIKNLSGWQFIILHAPVPGSGQLLWTYNHNTGATAAVANPVAGPQEDTLTIAVDKGGRRLFCMVQGASSVRIFQCYFDSLGTWTELDITSAPTLTLSPAAGGRELLFFWKGSLYLFNFYAAAYYRAVIDSAAPAVNFERLQVTFASNAGFNIVASKHTNLAYCPLDGCVYMHGGDVVDSYSQEMFKYHVATGTWTQIQNKCGADPSGNVNGVRPLNPDDGGWMWDSTEGAFWWFNGGGGFGQSNGTSYIRQCSDMPTFTEWTALYATHGETISADGRRDLASAFNAVSRWKAYEHMTFNPTTGVWAVQSLTLTNSEGWGSSVLARFYGGETGRGNAYDPVARKYFRLVQGGGFNLFVADLAAKTWRPFTCSKLADGTYWNYGDLQGYGYGMQCFAVDTSNGRLYGVRGLTGDLFYIDTRATPILHDGGPTYRLPIYVLDNPLQPAPGSFIAMTTYMRIYKGGLLFWETQPDALSGEVFGAWWRSLTNVESSEWIPIQFPFNFTANSVTNNAISNDSYMAMGGLVEAPGSFVTYPLSAWVVS